MCSNHKIWLSINNLWSSAEPCHVVIYPTILQVINYADNEYSSFGIRFSIWAFGGTCCGYLGSWWGANLKGLVSQERCSYAGGHLALYFLGNNTRNKLLNPSRAIRPHEILGVNKECMVRVISRPAYQCKLPNRTLMLSNPASPIGFPWSC